MELSYQRHRLENGVVLLTCTTERVPLVSFSAFLRVGKDRNPESLPGLAAMTSRLLDEGTERRSDREISRQVEDVGAELSIFSDRELTGICFDLAREDLDVAVELSSDFLRRPLFDSSALEREKRKISNHLASLRDDPQTLGSDLLNRLIYQGTPLEEPTLGREESVKRMRREDLQELHRRSYGPRDTVLVAVGDFKEARCRALVERCFGDWTNPEWVKAVSPPLRRQEEPRQLTRSLDKEQVHLYLGHLGFPRSDPDFYVCQVLDAVLGGGPGFTSRIPRRIRDDLGLAYVAYADSCGSAGVFPGRFVAYAATSPDRYGDAREEILGELRRFVDTGPTPEEVDRAVQFLTGSFVFDFQSNADVARFLLGIELYDLPPDHLETYPQLVSQVTPQEVLEVARQRLDTVNYSSVLVGRL